MAKTSNPLFNQTSGKIGSLVITSNGIVRERVYHNPSRTPAQVRVRANLSGQSQSWRGLSEIQRGQWAALEAQMNMVRTASPSGYKAYMQINGNLLACGKPVVATAPASPAPPATLPPLMIDPNLAPEFTLSIMSAAYAGTVQVYATAPVSAGRNSFSDSEFKLLGALSALTSGSTSLTTLYNARFPAPVLGQKIAVRLYPISAQGFRGSPIVAVVSAEASLAAAAGSAPAEAALKAA